MCNEITCIKKVTCKNNENNVRDQLLYPLLEKNLYWSKPLEGTLHHSLFGIKCQLLHSF